MKINFVVEDMFVFKYIGCSTVARTLYHGLKKQNGIDLTWERYKFHADISHYHTFGPIALLNRRLASGKKILTAHSTPRVNIGNLALTKTINKRYPEIFRKFDHIITISEACEKEVREMVPDVPITRIPNGIDREYFSPSSEKRDAFRDFWSIAPEERVVLTVAQISPRKGFYDFMKLASRNLDTRFIWVGGFPYGLMSKDYLKIKTMIQRKPENVLFTGFVRDITEAYCAADVFLMPTYAETFGLAVLEAQACGLPVIARDIPEFHEIYKDSIRYFKTPDDAHNELADEQQLRRCAAKAREYSSQYDIQKICREHLCLYEELVLT
ncbi:MAG TPA: glycosyltransferase family 4 protein [Methanospirillum sp.]|uniref:glycosyltransferase family 4 protein n=1 Tax=Methanospirillum sp. TaxID=45200 RepID=UPI002C3108B8|nr:glycosyltransferase family 4 protein [Methanospirillum sp.]HOJ96040.1 glycosyltransferase family 4 protein [Methanospirillum sp.]